MLRRYTVSTSAGVLGSQIRLAHVSSQSATLAPVPGQSAGMTNVYGDVTGSGMLYESERRRPILRSEVAPKKKEWNSIATMHKWGNKSLTLFRRVNEDAGQWYLAGEASLVSAHSMLSADVAAGLWSGIERQTYGLVEGNKRPDDLYRQIVGKRDKNGAIVVDYEESAEMRKTEPQLFLVPHTKEHAMHQRLKNPALPKFKEIENIHFRRVLRETQYHLGNSLRFYIVDGVFGNNTETGTPYRIITDNASHAYTATISACRNFNYIAPDEIELVKRAGGDPLEEYAWRKPGVLIYHCPAYDFEAPRIVEEFGGPRPADLGLKHQKFTIVDPYSIPMKAVMGGILEAEELFKTTAFLCSRWGFYADNRGLVTLDADSIVSKDGKTLTVVIGAPSETVRASPYLHSTRNIRVGDGVVSRCWDSVVAPSKATTRDRDLVEASTGTIFRPATTRYNSEKALSHRLLGNRTPRGFHNDHQYTTDAASRAAAGGHLLGKSASAEVETNTRAAAFNLEDTKFVVLGAKGTVTAEAAAKTIVANMAQKGMLYAEEEKLLTAITTALSKAKSVSGEDNLAKIVKGE